MPNERAAAAPVEPSATPRAATPQRLLRGIRPASADE
jgi:hypothetical protein